MRALIPHRRMSLWPFLLLAGLVLTRTTALAKTANSPLPLDSSGWILTHAAYDIRVESEGAAHVNAVLKVEIFDEEWHRIPTPGGGVVFLELRSERISDGTTQEEGSEQGQATLVADPELPGGYGVELAGIGKHTFTLEFEAAVSSPSADGYSSLEFSLPPSPIHDGSIFFPHQQVALSPHGDIRMVIPEGSTSTS